MAAREFPRFDPVSAPTGASPTNRAKCSREEGDGRGESQLSDILVGGAVITMIGAAAFVLIGDVLNAVTCFCTGIMLMAVACVLEMP